MLWVPCSSNNCEYSFETIMQIARNEQQELSLENEYWTNDVDNIVDIIS